MRDETIQLIKRIMAAVIGVMLLYASITFSNMGFAFSMDSKEVMWIGWVLAFSITSIELVFNGQLAYQQRNITLFVLGIAAYLYGVSSNVIGVWQAQSIDMASLDFASIKLWLGLFIGVFLELAPEPLIVYGLIGISSTEGDMIGALFNTFNGGVSRKPITPLHQNYSNQQPNRQPTNKPLPQRPMRQPDMAFHKGKESNTYIRDGWDDSVEEFRNIMRDK